MNSIVYVGMDVHKESYTLCCYCYDTDKVEYKQTIPSDYKLILKYMESMRLSEYIVTYEYLTEKIERLDHRIEELASGEKYKEKVKNMGCFLGIKTHTALSMVVEIGGHKSIALKERQQGCSVEVIAYADKANEGLRRRFYKMTLNKGINRNVAATAIARELACFMWGMATGNIG